MTETRAYRMVERARAVDETRRSVTRAASALLSGEGYAHVSLTDVAQAADVSRATIYNQFGSRSGLLEAVTTEAEERAGFARLASASKSADASEALVETAGELVGFYAAAGPLFTNLMALARTDPDAAGMVDRKEAARRDLFTGLIDRADRDGRLACDRTRATALVLAITTHRAVHELLDASPSVEAAQQHVRWIVRRLLDPPDRG